MLPPPTPTLFPYTTLFRSWVEPVTVTATRAPLDVFSSPLPTEALSEDRLRRAQSVSLAHALAELPGINALSTGQQIERHTLGARSEEHTSELQSRSDLVCR